MTAIETLLAGLFDYAGLYPPANLSLRSAANNYIDYARSEKASALGRFIINSDRIEELRAVAGDSLSEFRLSFIAAQVEDWGVLTQQGDGFAIDGVEIQSSDPAEIERIVHQLPHDLTTYFEVPINAAGQSALPSISAAGARAKIRMGGVILDAFPTVPDVVQILKALAGLRLPFKATAGLHHPVRSIRPLTYQRQGPIGMMHGFVNLACAAAVLFFDGDAADAIALLEEQDPSAWRVTADRIQWHDQSWTVDQLSALRSRFLISIGSCSFEEPIRNLQSLGWL